MELDVCERMARLDRDNIVYRKRQLPLVWFYEQDEAIAEQARLGGNVPIWVCDKEPVKRADGTMHMGKKYAVCSYDNIVHIIRQFPRSLRNFYEMLRHHKGTAEGWPANFVVDIDLKDKDYAGVIDVGIAERAQNELIDIVVHVISVFVKHGVRGWTTAWGRDDIEISMLYSDVPGVKASRHMVFHLPDRTMFKNVLHLKAFMAFIYFENARRHEQAPDENPFFFLHKNAEMACIVDTGIYTANRPFRLIGNQKRSLGDGVEGNFLAPLCTHPGQDCAEADCLYRHRHSFLDEDFYANLVCYRPPGPDGEPVTPHIVEVPDIPCPWLAANKDILPVPTEVLLDADALARGLPRRGVSGAARVQQSARGDGRGAIVYVGERAATVAWGELLGEGGGDDGSDGEGGHVPSVHDIIMEIVSILADELRAQVTVKECDDRGNAFVQTNSRVCPRGGLRVTTDGRSHQEHHTNHVSYRIELRLPNPIITRVCLSPKCMALDDRRSANSRFFIPEDRRARVIEMLEANMMSQQVPPSIFSL